MSAPSESRAGSPPGVRAIEPSMIPWHLELGAVEQHQLALEHSGRELALCFAPPLDATLPLTRIALVQPGSQQEQPPWFTPARSLVLPWPRAPLDDLWLLLCTPGRRYWLEVPYGVCRSPDARREAPQLGPPRPPSDAAADAVILPWQTIRWKLGHAGGWQLTVLARHARAGELELVARRADPGPPPAIDVTASVDARPLAIEQAEAWGAAPAAVHVARYRFPPSPIGARAYVRLTAKSGAAAFELQLPTSLTERNHRWTGRRDAAR